MQFEGHRCSSLCTTIRLGVISSSSHWPGHDNLQVIWFTSNPPVARARDVHVLRPGRQFYRLGSALAFKRLFAIDTFVNERKLGTIRSLARYPSHCDSTWSCQWSFKAVAMMFKLFISKSSKAVPPASWPELLPGLASRWSAIVNSAVSSSVRSIVGPGITTLICSPLSESSESLIHSRGQSMMMSEMTLAASCFP
jgi:hypothetical protein